MTNTNKVVLASGIVLGIGSIYAYKEKINFDSVVEKFENNQDVFNGFVKKLAELTVEILQKIFNFITELIRKILFQIKLAIN